MDKARTGYIRKRAENLSIGQEALPTGTSSLCKHCTKQEQWAMAEIEVIKKPRIAILSTGDELVQPGTELDVGQIYESNSHALASLVERWGARKSGTNQPTIQWTNCEQPSTLYQTVMQSSLVEESAWVNGISFVK